MRILHLAYEDPGQPGSGGGSVRTRELNRRLGQRHDITAVAAAYPGARSRMEGGVRWVHIGPRVAGRTPRLAYFALLGIALRRYRSDIVVEDFGAPFSVGLSPLLTRRPVVASVQWLFARQMRAKYHLPFDIVERAGIRAYGDFISVSDWLATEIRRRHPRALVETIPNGIDPLAFQTPSRVPTHLAFVGRLDIAQKGGDLLVGIAARLQALLGTAMPTIQIVGDGPDRARMEALVRAAGLDPVVRFLGRLDGARKFEAMASAYAVLMPSRFETFGIVAVEAQAAGAPIVAFDVGPLREVAGGGGARLIAPFDLDAFANETARLVSDPALRSALASSGRRWASRYDWDTIAERQEAHYVAALERFRGGRSA
jgi:glycosyltransferase involved in cell wall biosynthesis